jgi:hypothetical protein
MSIPEINNSSHELRELFFNEEEFSPDVDLEEEDFDDEDCYMDLGDQEVKAE